MKRHSILTFHPDLRSGLGAGWCTVTASHLVGASSSACVFTSVAAFSVDCSEGIVPSCRVNS